MRILCTNDDGVHAVGLSVLARAARSLAGVDVVAPDREQSASSHSLTLDRPLRATRGREGEYVIDGTPTDCVLVAVNKLLDRRPDFVLSGVNHGPNMGEDVLYSGTVAAAMEGTILGIPAVAISFAGRDPDRIPQFEPLLGRLLGSLLKGDQFPAQTVLNINIPDRAADRIAGVRVTVLGRRTYSDSLTRMSDPGGREYYWIGGGSSHWSGVEESDFRAVEAGYISVTPLHLDLTNHRLLESVSTWSIEI